MTYSVVYALVGDEGSSLLQFFSIAKTQFLFIENIKHKSSSSSTIYKTSDSSRKRNIRLKTVLPVFKIKHCSQIVNNVIKIIYTAVSKQYTKK